jgi:RimJ/RimL family protein N-acetyltransferase
MVEIGYGVAPAHRRRGHATRAVAALLAEAARDPKVHSVVAETAVANRPSQRALEANGFGKTGTRMTEDDGEVICWRLVKA